MSPSWSLRCPLLGQGAQVIEYKEDLLFALLALQILNSHRCRVGHKRLEDFGSPNFKDSHASEIFNIAVDRLQVESGTHPNNEIKRAFVKIFNEFHTRITFA